MLPSQEDIIISLLRIIDKRGGQVVFSRTGEAIEWELGKLFSLSNFEITETRSNRNGIGEYRIWRKHIQWARKKAVEQGYMDGNIRNLWKLTEKGKRYISANL